MDLKSFIDSDGILWLPEEVKCFDDLNIISKITSLGYNCFDFSTLKGLGIPASVSEIKWCFYECSNLQNIFVSEANLKYKSIDGVLYTRDNRLVAFPNGRTGEYHIPNYIVDICKLAFKTSHINDIYIPKSVKKVGTNAFYQSAVKCVHIEDINIDLGRVSGTDNYHFEVECNGRMYSYEEFLKLKQI